MHNWIKCSLAMALLGLSACANKDAIIPQGGRPIAEVYRENASSSAMNPQLKEDRAALRRSLTEREDYRADHQYTRDSSNEIHSQFARLDNPDLVMYVFPHLTKEGLPVPGYSTVFPMFDGVEYAMPGEQRFDVVPDLLDYQPNQSASE